MNIKKGFHAYKKYWEDQASFMDQSPWNLKKILKLTISNDFNKNIFSGPHPAGNVGIHIHHLDPISQGESVWVVKPEDVCVIGNLFKTGEYNPSRTIAVSGPPVKNPMYFFLKCFP